MLTTVSKRKFFFRLSSNKLLSNHNPKISKVSDLGNYLAQNFSTRHHWPSWDGTGLCIAGHLEPLASQHCMPRAPHFHHCDNHKCSPTHTHAQAHKHTLTHTLDREPFLSFYTKGSKISHPKLCCLGISIILNLGT